MYASNSTTVPLPGGEIGIQQISEYPFEGTTKIILNPKKRQHFNLKLRIPTWAQGTKFLPGNLYSFENKNQQQEWKMIVNGKGADSELKNGFITIDRNWSKGDTVELILDMNVKWNKANDLVLENKNKLAVTRGPFLFCTEDGDYNKLRDKLFVQTIPDNLNKIERFSDTELKGIPYIYLPLAEKDGENLKKTDVQFIPYYSWNNRGNRPMMVWLNTNFK
jgi:uncharacterized protein